VICLCAALLFAWVPWAAQAGFHNGNEYLKWPRMLKITYVSGVYDGLEEAFNGETGTPSPGKPALAICMPDSVTAEQMTDVVTKYIHDHPADRHLNGADLVDASLKAAFPCPPR